MKRNIFIVLSFTILPILVLITVLYYKNHIGESYASSGLISEIKERDGIDYSKLTPKELQLLTPLAIKFNPLTTQGQQYGNTWFYENMMADDYGFYAYISRKPNAKYTVSDYDFAVLLENWQSQYGSGGYKLVDESYSLNLKYGYMVPNTKTWKSGGHMQVKSGKYKGLTGVEYRYIGYAANGYAITNPIFPADTLSNSNEYWDLNFIKKSWTPKGGQLMTASPYTLEELFDSEILYSWWEGIVFKQYPEFKEVAKKNGAKTLREQAQYWSERVMFQTNPENGTGILRAWHISDGRVLYRSLVLNPPNKPNLRMTSLKIYETDEETGERELIGKSTLSATSLNPKEVDVLYNKYISKGKTYHVEVTVRNMTSDAPHNTNQTPTLIDYHLTYDDNIYLYEKYDKSIIGEVVSTNQPKTIKYETNANFEFDITIPNTFNEEIEIRPMINNGFNLSGDNYNTNDDSLGLIFKVAPEDMEISDTIELYDAMGNLVDAPVAGNAYSVKFIVTKPSGSLSVGKKNSAKNPYTTLYVSSSDGLSTLNQKVQATKTLKSNGSVEVIANNIVPKGPYIEVCGIIDSIHNQLGYNDDTTNDGPVCKIFVGENNFAVKDLKVTPGSVIRATGEAAGKETLTFNFNLINVEANKQAREVYVVLSSNGTILKKERVLIPEGVELPVTWVIDNVSLNYGTKGFKVEVNPNPREYYELKKDGSLPYEDNVATTSMQVYQNPFKYNECDVVNTNNTWKQTYYIYEWRGHVEYYDCSYDICIETSYYEVEHKYEVVIDGKVVEKTYTTTHSYCSEWERIEKTCDYCTVEDEWTEKPTISYYESFKITKVLFSSKETKDKYGGDGKIDLLTNGPGKIKAGYGFTLEVYTEYKTNSFSSAPVPWTTRCSGKTVSPGYTVTQSPESISLKMPYTDKKGKAVYYNLNGTASGTWDNKSVYYSLPYRDAFGIKSVPQIFINEGAKNGIYTIQIDTADFYGSADKVGSNWKNLCDSVKVQIEIVGGGTQDLNTHIVQ